MLSSVDWNTHSRIAGTALCAGGHRMLRHMSSVPKSFVTMHLGMMWADTTAVGEARFEQPATRSFVLRMQLRT